MKWSLLALAAVLSLSGCHHKQPVVNPFMGPTVVPPPATGAAAPATAPYYQGTPLQGTPPPAYTAPGGLPPAGAYNPPAGSTIQTPAPATTQPSTTPSYTPPAGNYNYRQSAPAGSSTRVTSPTTDALAARRGIGHARVASSDTVYLDQSIPVTPTSAKSIGSPVRTIGSGPSNEPRIQVPRDSKPDRLQMDPVGAIRRVSYDAPSEPGTTGRPPARPLFSAPPLPSQDRPAPSRSVVRPSVGRPTPAGPPTASFPAIRKPVAQAPVARPAVNYAASQPATRQIQPTEPRRFVQPSAMVEISDLPPARSRSSVGSPRNQIAASSSSQPRTSSYQAPTTVRASKSQPTPAASPQSVPAKVVASDATVQPSPRYGHDPNYRWLTGKLEYSRTRREWKLRYIPIDGETDDYGGSVLIANEESLQAFEAGDYVALQGEIMKTAGDARSFSPKYQVSRAKALSN